MQRSASLKPSVLITLCMQRATARRCKHVVNRQSAPPDRASLLPAKRERLASNPRDVHKWQTQSHSGQRMLGLSINGMETDSWLVPWENPVAVVAAEFVVNMSLVNRSACNVPVDEKHHAYFITEISLF